MLTAMTYGPFDFIDYTCNLKEMCISQSQKNPEICMCLESGCAQNFNFFYKYAELELSQLININIFFQKKYAVMSKKKQFLLLTREKNKIFYLSKKTLLKHFCCTLIIIMACYVRAMNYAFNLIKNIRKVSLLAIHTIFSGKNLFKLFSERYVDILEVLPISSKYDIGRSRTHKKIKKLRYKNLIKICVFFKKLCKNFFVPYKKVVRIKILYRLDIDGLVCSRNGLHCS